MSYNILAPEPNKIKTPPGVRLGTEMNALVFHGPGSIAWEKKLRPSLFEETDALNIDSKTIRELGLRLSDKKINAVISPLARVFEYPYLDNVFIMENDLYGSIMPKGSCFLAFYGHHGLIGKDLSIETLKNSTVADIKNMVECNMEG